MSDIVSEDSVPVKSPWLYHDKEVTEADLKGIEAFVYLITHVPSGKRYIGKKNVYTLRKPRVTKKVPKPRRKKAESDWRDYWSSSDVVKDLVAAEGEGNFKREILALCKLRAAANWLEVKLMFDYKVLESNEWFNDNINGKWFSGRCQKYLAEDIKF